MTIEARRPLPPAFGEPAPRFTAPTDGVPRYAFEVAAGRWMVLLAFGSLANPVCRAGLETVLSRRSLFNDADAAFFGLSIDPSDRLERGLANEVPGVRYFWDFERLAAEKLGLIFEGYFEPRAFLIDRSFRVVERRGVDAVEGLLDRLEAELAAETTAAAPFAPVLLAPRVFEPDVCQALIALFEASAPEASGFSKEVEGRTVQRLNPALKRRQDVLIEDPRLIGELERRLRARLFPMIESAFAWRATQIERFLLCRYEAQDQGFFSAHRDNVTSGTAHRRFAVSLNLNADFEGGDLRFPEFGPRTYRPPAGGAAVFSCSLLHEVAPVLAGVRYVFVPFLYDEEDARLRQENLSRVDLAPARGARP